MQATQGHLYAYGTAMRVIAMTSGATVKVRELVPDQPWLGPAWIVHASDLKPLPMKYFGGQVPRS